MISARERQGNSHFSSTRQSLLQWLAITASMTLLPLSVSAQANMEVYSLAPHTTGSKLAAAKQAFESGQIIEMTGDHQADFDSLLDVTVPELEPVTLSDSRSSGSQTASSTERMMPVLEIEAARLASDGMHAFQCSSGGSPLWSGPPNSQNCAALFGTWVAEEQNPQTQSFPAPEIADWTNLGQIDMAYSDNYLSLNNRVRLFRLNDLNSNWDSYMIVRDPLSTPNFQRCDPFGSCGWYTDLRDFQISLDGSVKSNPNYQFFDWSPQQEIGSGTGELPLGFSLDSVAPTPGVGYTFS